MRIKHETILFVNLNALRNNFLYFRKTLNSTTEIIAVIKAFGYGHGDIKIAKELSKLGVYGFWVADFEEGVQLRKAGIEDSIIVANPGSKSYDDIISYNLEPVIYNYNLLDLYGCNNQSLPIHLKFNTGMNRYGFNIKDVTSLTARIKKYSHLNIKSLCSHLAASNDETKDPFTISQFKRFNKICRLFSQILDINPDTHILNTSGVLRFSKQQKNIVRLGIGLYGVADDINITPISELISMLIQVRTIRKNDAVGYNSSCVAKESMKIGVVPLGYADGINRKLGNGQGQVMIHRSLAPIIGEISMDSFIIDISKIDAKEGDPVIIFGQNHPVINIAQNLNTIPYEILATLNKRIKRVYHKNTENK